MKATPPPVGLRQSAQACRTALANTRESSLCRVPHSSLESAVRGVAHPATTAPVNVPAVPLARHVPKQEPTRQPLNPTTVTPNPGFAGGRQGIP